MIGSLLYLTASQPDIMFSVCLCVHFQEDPKSSHLEAVKRIFRYIKETTHLGLWYPKGTGIETIVYVDSDHAGDYVDRKSTSGVCTFMRCCLTSWFSKKQTALAVSTTKSEYVSAGKACQQELWIKQALVDYGIKLDDIPVICDNKGAIDLTLPVRCRLRGVIRRNCNLIACPALSEICSRTEYIFLDHTTKPCLDHRPPVPFCNEGRYPSEKLPAEPGDHTNLIITMPKSNNDKKDNKSLKRTARISVRACCFVNPPPTSPPYRRFSPPRDYQTAPPSTPFESPPTTPIAPPGFSSGQLLSTPKTTPPPLTSPPPTPTQPSKKSSPLAINIEPVELIFSTPPISPHPFFDSLEDLPP
ncbi:hypothetical protein Tco_1265869 [Tanacetum coccineum]